MFYNMKDDLRLIITCVVSLISNYVSYMTTMIKQITHTHKHTHTNTHTHIYAVDERHRQTYNNKHNQMRKRV